MGNFTSSVMSLTRATSEEPARLSNSERLHPLKSCWLLPRTTATRTYWLLPPKLAYWRWATTKKHLYAFNWNKINTGTHLYKLLDGVMTHKGTQETDMFSSPSVRQRVEEAQQERRELVKAMRLLQEEKQQLQEEQKRLAREREQERETCCLLRTHNQVRERRRCELEETQNIQYYIHI